MPCTRPPRIVWFLSLCLLIAVPVLGADPTFTLPAELPAWNPDVVRITDEHRTLRVLEDLNGLQKRTPALLREHGDQDWALEAALLNLTHTHSFEDLRRILAERDPASLGVAALEPAAWDLLSGLFWYSHERAATADSLLAAAAAARPDWLVTHGYRFRAGLNLLRPASELQAHLDAAAGSGSGFDEIVLWALFQLELDDATHQAMVALLERNPRTRRYESMLEWERLRRRLPSLHANPVELEDAWAEFSAQRAADAGMFLITMAYEAISRLAPRDALAFLSRVDPGPPRTDTAIPAASVLMDQGRYLEARRLLSGRTLRSAAELTTNFRLAQRLDDGPAILAAFDRLAREYPARALLLGFETGLQSHGDEDRWPALIEATSRENPLARQKQRLGRFTVRQAAERSALVDSLTAADVPWELFSDYKEAAVLLLAEPEPFAEILAVSDPLEREQRLMLEMKRFYNDGDQRRTAAACLALLPLAEGRPSLLAALHELAIDMQDPDLAAEVIAVVDRCDPHDPLILDLKVRHQASFGTRAQALALLNGVDPEDPSWSEPDHLVSLVTLADHYDLLDLADRASRRALELAPRSYMARAARASMLERLDQLEAAGRLLNELVAEYPGDEFLAGQMLATQASVVSLADLPEQDDEERDPFTVFGHGPESSGDLVALAIPAAEQDTLMDDMVVLQQRESIVLEGLNSALRRTRKVLQVLTEAGAEAERIQVVPFSPDDGVPRLLTARVLTPDGEVLETSRSDVIVRAAEGSDVDVTDEREMVIPLRGLAPGAIVELTHESRGRSLLGGGWSNVWVVTASTPMKQAVIEVAAPESTPLHAVAFGGFVEDETDGAFRRWTARDLAPVLQEEWSEAWTETQPWVGLTTHADWGEVAAIYAETFWRHAAPDASVAAAAAEIVTGVDGDRERFEALYRWVVEEIDGLAVELGAGRLVPTPPAEVLTRGWGDCKDKSALLIAMLETVGIEARPVLVSTAGGATPREDFPTTLAFNHMIVQVTGVKGDPYCDPINGAPCPQPLPAFASGRPGLHVSRDGDWDFRLVGDESPEDHTFEITMDVRPVDDTRLRYDVTGRYTGEPAAFMRTLAAVADTSFQRDFLDHSTGYGVPGGVELRRWSFEVDDCGGVVTSMAYLDTAWVAAGANSAQVQSICEAPVYWGMPKSEARRTDVHWRAPYRARVVLRLHDSDTWTVDDRIPGHRLRGEHHEGRIRVDTTKENGRRVVVVTHDYELKHRVIPAEDYRQFSRECIGYFMHAAAIRRWYRTIDEERLAADLAYVEEFPEDQGMRFNAAMRLLGDDLGGHGAEGPRRRQLARGFLLPLLENDEAARLACVVLAGMETMDGRYLRADSLLTAVSARLPADRMLLNLHQNLKSELGDTEARIPMLERLVNMSADPEAVAQLIGCYTALGRQEDIDRHLQRLERLGRPLPPLKLMLARVGGYDTVEDPEGFAAVLEEYRPLIPEEFQRALESQLLMLKEEWRAAADLLDQLIAENPTNHTMLNNYAWCCAMGGFDLERAQELAEASAALADDPSAAGNTLAAVHARRGDWKRAREMFRELYAKDDRPSDRLVNGYFWGLCEAKTGDPEEALRIWNALLEQGGTGSWVEKTRRSREALASGDDPVEVVFGSPS